MCRVGIPDAFAGQGAQQSTTLLNFLAVDLDGIAA